MRCVLEQYVIILYPMGSNKSILRTNSKDCRKSGVGLCYCNRLYLITFTGLVQYPNVYIKKSLGF